jgi:hypothetical protein
MNIRILNEQKDIELLREAWAWRDSAPQWFKSLNTENETWDEFIANAHEELLIGIFDESLLAVIRLVQHRLGLFELHLMTRRKADWNILLQAGLSAKQYLFDKKVAQTFFGWIPRRNKGIVRLYRALGFVHNGERCYKGQTHGRPIEWLLFQSNR